MVASIVFVAVLSLNQTSVVGIPKVPDVLIVNTAELTEAEQALASQNVPADRLVKLPHKRLNIAVYGFLAKSLTATERYAKVADELARSGTLGGESAKVLRESMETSPFRDVIRGHSQDGKAMTVRIDRSTVVWGIGSDGKYRSATLRETPVTKDMEWDPKQQNLIKMSTAPLNFSPLPRRPVRGLACIVRPLYPASERVSTMAEALRVYSQVMNQALEKLGKTGSAEDMTLNPQEQQAMRQRLLKNYEEFGFSSAEEAMKVLGNATFSRNSFVKVEVKFLEPDGTWNKYSWPLVDY